MRPTTRRQVEVPITSGILKKDGLVFAMNVVKFLEPMKESAIFSKVITNLGSKMVDVKYLSGERRTYIGTQNS